VGDIIGSVTALDVERDAHPNGWYSYRLTDESCGPLMLCRLWCWTGDDGSKHGDGGPVDWLDVDAGCWRQGTTSPQETGGCRTTIDFIVGYPGDDPWDAWWPAAHMTEDQARAWASKRGITI
jgi:hypothetical protein